MSARMRAKVFCQSVERFQNSEILKFSAVAAKSYPADGSDENNTYAKYSPSATFQLQCANPALFGQFEPGEEYYVDFTPAAVKAEQAA